MGLTKIFWTVVALNVVAAVTLQVGFAGGPHGQFDGLVKLFYMLMLAAIAVMSGLFLLLPAGGWRVAAFVVLLFPSASLVLWSAASVVNRF